MKPERTFRQRLMKDLQVTILAAALMAFFVLIATSIKPLNPMKRALENFSFTDIYYEILRDSGEPDTSRVITIVDITRLTNRTDIANTLRDIEAAGPKVVGVDCCFDNEGEDLEGNYAITSVAEDYDNIVWALKMLDHSGIDSIGWTKEIHSFFAYFVDITEGTVNMPRTLYDPTKRTLPLSERFEGSDKPSIAVKVANAYAGKDLTYGRTGDIKINFSPTVFRVLQPEDVPRHPELITDQIVMFGAMYEDADTHWVPGGKIAGVELLAYSIQTLIYSKEFKTLSKPLYWLISFLLVLMAQVLVGYFVDWTWNSENIMLKFLVGSTYSINILLAIVSVLFVYLGFRVFAYYNISFNMAWVLSVIAFLGTARLMHTSIVNYKTAKARKREEQQAKTINQQ